MGLEIENIRRALRTASGKNTRKVLTEQCSAFEKETLSHHEFTDKCLDLIIEILSSKELFTKKGISCFLVTIATDLNRLTDKQKQRLLNTICDNYYQYCDMEMCWQLGDMIARSYDQHIAMQAFRNLFSNATDQGREGIVLGLDIIARQSKNDPQLIKEIKAILHSTYQISSSN